MDSYETESSKIFGSKKRPRKIEKKNNFTSLRFSASSVPKRKAFSFSFCKFSGYLEDKMNLRTFLPKKKSFPFLDFLHFSFSLKKNYTFLFLPEGLQNWKISRKIQQPQFASAFFPCGCQSIFKRRVQKIDQGGIFLFMNKWQQAEKSSSEKCLQNPRTSNLTGFSFTIGPTLGTLTIVSTGILCTVRTQQIFLPFLTRQNWQEKWKVFTDFFFHFFVKHLTSHKQVWETTFCDFFNWRSLEISNTFFERSWDLEKKNSFTNWLKIEEKSTGNRKKFNKFHEKPTIVDKFPRFVVLRKNQTKAEEKSKENRKNSLKNATSNSAQQTKRKFLKVAQLDLDIIVKIPPTHKTATKVLGLDSSLQGEWFHLENLFSGTFPERSHEVDLLQVAGRVNRVVDEAEAVELGPEVVIWSLRNEDEGPVLHGAIFLHRHEVPVGLESLLEKFLAFQEGR